MMIQRKRINNDVFIRWAIMKPNNTPEDFTTATIVKLQARSKSGNKYIDLPYDRINNLFDIQFPANLQKEIGIYNLYLTYNKPDVSVNGGIATYTLDYCDAFELVPVTCLLLDPQEDPINIQGIIAAFSYSMMTDAEKNDLAARLSGQDRASLVLKPNSYMIRKKKNGTFVPSTILVTADAKNTTVSEWKVGVNNGAMSTITSSASPIPELSLTGNTVTISTVGTVYDTYQIWATDGTRTDSVNIQSYEDGYDGSDGSDGSHGGAGSDGSDGSDGKTIRNIQVYIASEEAPPTPTDMFAPPTGWTLNYETLLPLEEGERIWSSQITKEDNTFIGGWTVPVPFTALDGVPGKDGTKVEFIFKLTQLPNAPTTPTSEQQDDYVPPTWSDDPEGISEEFPYEWVSIRYKEEGVWGLYSTPQLWGVWGQRGIDGDTVEFIFRRTENDAAPARPNMIVQEDDFIPGPGSNPAWSEQWTDNPVGPDPITNLKYEWVCKRKREDGVWGAFSEPAHWANWSEDGKPGKDGEGEQTIFRRTEEDIAPSMPENDPAEEFVPQHWTRYPTGVTNNWPYEWVSKRIKEEEVWGNFSAPAKYATFSEDGADGQQGLDGMLVRTTEWALGQDYHNDYDLVGNVPRWLDIVIIIDEFGDFDVYKCKASHTSTAANKPGSGGSWNTYWEAFAQLPPIYTPLILADQAIIRFMQGNQLVIQDSAGVVVAGLTGSNNGGSIRIWAGGNLPSNAKFKVHNNGTIEGTNYEFDHTGSGYVAGGNISWNAFGDLTVFGKYQSNDSGSRIVIDPTTRELTLYSASNQAALRIYYNNSSAYANLLLQSTTNKSFIEPGRIEIKESSGGSNRLTIIAPGVIGFGGGFAPDTYIGKVKDINAHFSFIGNPYGHINGEKYIFRIGDFLPTKSEAQNVGISGVIYKDDDHLKIT